MGNIKDAMSLRLRARRVIGYLFLCAQVHYISMQVALDTSPKKTAMYKEYITVRGYNAGILV